MKYKLLYIVLILLLSNCKKDTGRELIETAKYKVTLNLNWNGVDFPVSYPSNAHFSTLIGCNHQSNTSFFELGTMASEGISKMAELGSITPLNNEISARINNMEGDFLFVGSNLGSGVGTITVNVEVNDNNPSITLVSMLAPSPDWYIGTVNILLKEEEFVETKTVDVLVYDSGTDSGTTFTSLDTVTTPQEPITLLVDTPLGNGTVISPVIGTATFVKI
jgi:hypothetical protein